MKTHDDSFFAEPVDPKQEARFLALEVVCRLLVWMAEGASLDERGVRATVALFLLVRDWRKAGDSAKASPKLLRAGADLLDVAIRSGDTRLFTELGRPLSCWPAWRKAACAPPLAMPTGGS